MNDSTYTTADGQIWNLGAEHTVNTFKYRWDGAKFGTEGPLMVAVGREITVRLEWLAMAAAFDTAALAEHRPHDGSPTTCQYCRDYNGLPVVPLALPALTAMEVAAS